MPLFTIKTTLGVLDYRKALYSAAFLRNKLSTLPLGVIAMVLALVLSRGEMELSRVLLLWLILFAFFIVLCCMRIELKFSKRARTDATFGMPVKLEFFDDKMKVSSERPRTENEIAYNDLFEVLESGQLYLFYTNAVSASPVRKRDVADKEAFSAFMAEKLGRRFRRI